MARRKRRRRKRKRRSRVGKGQDAIISRVDYEKRFLFFWIPGGVALGK